MRARARRHGVAALALALTLFTLAGCSEDRKFSAEEFVAEVKAEGVELELGDELVTTEDKELYAVELEQVARLPGEEGEHEHTGGSLSVYENTAGADGEIDSCRMSADLLCYQAANVVIVLEGGGIEAQQLGVAMQRLSEE